MTLSLHRILKKGDRRYGKGRIKKSGEKFDRDIDTK